MVNSATVPHQTSNMSEQPTSPGEQAGVPAKTCPLCGAGLNRSDSCDRCDWTKDYGKPSLELRRNPHDQFACILSLFWPGAGHFYKGHAGLAAGLAGCGALCFLWSVTFLMFFGFLILPAYWLGVAAHAYFLPDLKHAPYSPLQASRHPSSRMVG